MRRKIKISWCFCRVIKGNVFDELFLYPNYMKNTYSREDICKDRDCSSWQGYQSRYLHSQTKKPWAQTISSHVKVKKEPLSIFSSCNINREIFDAFLSSKSNPAPFVCSRGVLFDEGIGGYINCVFIYKQTNLFLIFPPIWWIVWEIGFLFGHTVFGGLEGEL